MKYEVEVHQVVTERVTVEATSENDAMNIAGKIMHDEDGYDFDGMPEYKFTVKKILTDNELVEDN